MSNDVHPLDEDDTAGNLKLLREQLERYHRENKGEFDEIKSRVGGVESRVGELQWLVSTSRFGRAVGKVSGSVANLLATLGRWIKKILVPLLYCAATYYAVRALFGGQSLHDAMKEFWRILER